MRKKYIVIYRQSNFVPTMRLSDTHNRSTFRRVFFNQRELNARNFHSVGTTTWFRLENLGNCETIKTRNLRLMS